MYWLGIMILIQHWSEAVGTARYVLHLLVHRETQFDFVDCFACTKVLCVDNFNVNCFAHMLDSRC